MVKKQSKGIMPDPKVRTFFVLAFPTIIIIAIAMLLQLNINSASIMIVLAVYQFLMLKQFVDQYHEVL